MCLINKKENVPTHNQLLLDRLIYKDHFVNSSQHRVSEINYHRVIIFSRYYSVTAQTRSPIKSGSCNIMCYLYNRFKLREVLLCFVKAFRFLNLNALITYHIYMNTLLLHFELYVYLV